jgi:ABC-type branched-subunit amino acid transport system ATPase component
MSVTALEIQNLTVEVNGYPIINNLTLTVDEGKRIGIVGDFRDAEAVLDVFSGQTLPTSGEIWFYNMPPRQAFQRGLIQCEPNLQPLEASLALVTNQLSFPSHIEAAIVVVYPLIEFFNELIEKFYILIKLTPSRSDVKS